MKKKKLIAVIMVCIIVATLAGCKSKKSLNGLSSIESKPSSSSQVIESISAEKISSNSSQQLNIDPSKEPPLPEYCTKIPVPEFLNEEQQNLYRRAYSTTSFMFVGRANIECYPLLTNQKKDKNPQTTVEIDNITYSISNGRYQNWDDFNATMLSLFTEEYFNKINYTDTTPLFRPYNEKLCYLDSDRGSNIDISNRPDDFELISKTNDTIKIYVIGHYVEQHNDETDIEWGKRRDNGEYDRTEKYPITIVKTNNGWRFSEFNITI